MRANILITGASSGLGAEMARQFAARGRNLALCARRTDRLADLRGELLGSHPQRTVAVRALDVDDHDAVFDVFRAFDSDLGGIDRVVVNAGIGRGQPVGTGGFAANRATAFTNVVSALAQCEAAMELFRARGRGHLVVVSSVGAFRGMRGGATAYAASKAAVAALAEGIRADVLGSAITVTTVFPGYIRSEMTAGNPSALMAGTTAGVGAMVAAIERERATATVPAWPWVPIGWLLRHAPLRLVARVT